MKPADLQPFDLVVYFVRDQSQSVVVRTGGPRPPSNAAGWTATTGKGICSEVYVEMNLPARKLALLPESSFSSAGDNGSLVGWADDSMGSEVTIL
jgi:hypothetical protein